MSVSVDFQGRLGNNLYQYIAARLFAEKNGLRLVTAWNDPETVHMDTPRPSLDISDGKERLLTDDDNDILGQPFPRGRYRLRGFFARPDFFYPNREKILSFAHTSPINAINREDIVMNVRLGDFRPLGWVIHPSWYLGILEREVFKRLHVVVDEIDQEYLSHFKAYEPIVVSSGRVGDWDYLRSFDRVICSNSSFCWWAMFFGSASKMYSFKRSVGIPGSILVEGEFLGPSPIWGAL